MSPSQPSVTSEKPLTVEPIVVVMPDGSLAYTFKEVAAQVRQGGDDQTAGAGTASPQAGLASNTAAQAAGVGDRDRGS